MLTMDNDDGKAHFNLDDLLIDNDKKKSKRKKKMIEEKNKNAKEDDFKVLFLIWSCKICFSF